MPKLSDTMTEGKLVKWRKKVGDKIAPGDVIAEVETDKATMEMEAFDEGTLAKILVEEGGKVAIGKALAILAEDGEDIEEVAKSGGQSTASEAPKAVAEKAGAEKKAAAPPAPAKTPTGGRIKASPLARKVAAQHGVDLSTVVGTGPGGRIVANDVIQAAAAGGTSSASKPAPSSTPVVQAGEGDTRIELTGMRRVIAQRLVESKTQIPHFYLQVEMDAAPLLALRKQVNATAEKDGGPKITVNDFVLMAAARAAVEVPAVNASFAGDSIIQYAGVHVSVAVAVDDGLVTPVLRNADKLSLREISTTVKDLATRARGKKLKPEEYQGGTLTVSNLGAYGVESFSAIINPPQSLILAVGAIVKKPVVNDRDEIVPGHRMSVTLSCDHRVVDGAVGAQYLAALRRLIENPALMLF